MPREMTRLILLCTSVLIIVSSVSGNAPFDFATSCVNPAAGSRITPPTVEDNVCVLMDSRYYILLLGSFGVWSSFQTDQNGYTWVQALGGACSYQVSSCTYRRRQPQSNYLVTQFINSRTVASSPTTVNEVWIDLSYRFTGGNYAREFDLLYFETDTANTLASHDPSNYKVIETFAPGASMSSGSRSFSFETTPGKKGFYVSVRENGTCLSLSNIRVYTHCCKAQTAGLVTYPLAYAPAQSSSTPTVGEGQCADRSSVEDTTGSVAKCLGENSEGSSLLEVQCVQMGRWDQSRGCSCDPGHSLDTSSGSSQCKACPANTYKSTYSNVDSCLPCPQNSESGSGSSCCTCSDGFFRTMDEAPDVPCTGSPSKPLNVQVVGTGSDSITITWDASLDTGGRSDVSYSIEYQESAMLFRGYLPAGNVESGSARSFTVGGLSPVTEYTIRVTAENGVSEQDPDSREGRTAVTTGTTMEGVPGKIEVFQNTRGNTFSWQPPAKANGVITGFVCRIFRDGNPEPENLVELGRFEFCFSPVSESIPSGSGPARIQVAAKTAVGVGELSDPLLLEIAVETQKSCSSLASLSNGEVVVMSSLVGGMARYFCVNGFNLVGNPSRVCQADETWSGNTPRCELISCGSLSSPSNAVLTFSDGTDLNSIAKYDCVEGYQPVSGAPLRFCRSDGTWSGEELVCGRAQPTSTPELPTCPPPSTECPTCPTPQSGMECSQLEAPENGAVSQMSSSVGSVVSYLCSSGYTLVGDNRRECRITSEWTGSAPTCEARTQCVELPNPDNGEVEYTNAGRNVGSVATYSCDAGSTLSGGTRFRLCQTNGEWSGSAPTCNPTCRNEGEVFSTCASSCRPTCENPTPSCVASCRLGCTCPQGRVFDESQFRCITVGDCPTEATFELRGQTYKNGSSIQLANIGEGNNALLFRTDYTQCCQSQRSGECYRPDETEVGVRANRFELYRNRGSQLIRLNRQSQFTTEAVSGIYCCEVPISASEVKRVCASIVA